jgi:hypothetical protein
MTKEELDKYKELELVVETLVDYCNNDAGMATACEVIAVEAALERLYKARQEESEVGEMTKYDIISMGEAADEYADNKLGKGEFHPDWHDVRDEWFADLVSAKVRKECAAICRKEAAETDKHLSIVIEALEDCAYLIEKRGEE